VVVGRRTFNKIKGKPERTIKNAEETVAAIKAGT
jgi:hypothetical protein